MIFTHDALGNFDHNKAAAPVTNGAAALVPLRATDWSWVLRLTIRSPGAANPLRPIARPRLLSRIGIPLRLMATTGMTQG